MFVLHMTLEVRLEMGPVEAELAPEPRLLPAVEFHVSLQVVLLAENLTTGGAWVTCGEGERKDI
jgi:hypothetical protein